MNHIASLLGPPRAACARHVKAGSIDTVLEVQLRHPDEFHQLSAMHWTPIGGAMPTSFWDWTS